MLLTFTVCVLIRNFISLSSSFRGPSFDLSIIVKFLVMQSAGSSSAADLEENYFDFRKQCFVYSKEKGTFCKLSYPTKETFGCYIKCSGHGSEAKVLAATEKWGRNVWVSLFSGHFIIL